MLKKILPLQKVWQEHKIEVVDDFNNKHSFFLDFFLPQLDIAIECHGIQHFERVGHFHQDILAFQKQQGYDVMKREWCKENHARLITFAYNEEITEKLVYKRIMEAI